MSIEFEEIKILSDKCRLFCKKTILFYLKYKLESKKRKEFISFQFETFLSNNY